jgi:hypothetical protein
MLLIKAAPPDPVVPHLVGGAARTGGVGPASGLSHQLIDSPKTVSVGWIGKAQLIRPWIISGIERPKRIER